MEAPTRRGRGGYPRGGSVYYTRGESRHRAEDAAAVDIDAAVRYQRGDSGYESGRRGAMRGRGRGRGSSSPMYFKEKVSIGIACCRFYRGRPQILMIQKRYTYAYSSFVHGAYDNGSDRAILALLNQMTVDEKIILQSLNFDIIWNHIWLTQSPHDTQKYRLMKGIFDSAFTYSGNNMRLHDLIARSVHGTRVWEIPKGRARKGEADIHCAVREFYEETGIEKCQYYLYAGATRSHTFIDEGVQYVQKYYIASTHRAIQPRICLDSRVQIEEVADIRWMSIDDIRFVDQTGRLERLVRPIFNYVKKRTPRLT